MNRQVKITIEPILEPRHVVMCPIIECLGNDGGGVCLRGPALLVSNNYQAETALQSGDCPDMVCEVFEAKVELQPELIPS